MRVEKARTVLGPLGAWWLKPRVEGVVDMLRKTQVRGAEPSGSGVRLLLEGSSGRSSLEVDHVIAGTGFHVNIDRLDYLPQDLRARIGTFSGYPVLTRAAESTVPGLYFVGATAAFGLGPSMRFIAGTHNVARQLTRSVASRSNGSRGARRRLGRVVRCGSRPDRGLDVDTGHAAALDCLCQAQPGGRPRGSARVPLRCLLRPP